MLNVLQLPERAAIAAIATPQSVGRSCPTSNFHNLLSVRPLLTLHVRMCNLFVCNPSATTSPISDPDC